METEVNITIRIRDTMDHFSEEDVVKSIWPYCTPFFTRRHGVNSGKIILENGAIELDWEYKDMYTFQEEVPNE